MDENAKLQVIIRQDGDLDVNEKGMGVQKSFDLTNLIQGTKIHLNSTFQMKNTN